MDKITGIVLSGGKSTRIGRDKAFLPFPQKPLIEVALDNLSGLFDKLLIVTNDPKPYAKYGIETVNDILPGRGPLGGIYTGLLTSDSVYNFIVACDMPFLKKTLIRYMIKEKENYDLVITGRNNRLEPLCAVYSKNCIKPIKKQLSMNNLKITDFFQQVKVKMITQEEVARFDLNSCSFININTPNDYRKYKINHNIQITNHKIK